MPIPKALPFTKKLMNAPKKPGCYLWKNCLNEVIYVGKAKNLFNRTHQYFHKSLNLRTSKLIESIFDIDYIIVSNEKEALILEQTLINDLKPKYNVLLRENKNYPYIVISKEKYPRLLYKFLSSNNDKKKYRAVYGPFVTDNSYEIFSLLNRLFPFRKCNLNQQRPCIYHGINQCLCPEFHNVNPIVFDQMCQELDNFFKGKTNQVIHRLVENEKQAASQLDFERATKYKKMNDNLSKILAKQVVDLQNSESVDVFAFAHKENIIAITIFQYSDGILKNKHEKIANIHGSIEEEIVNYLFQYYGLFEFQTTKKVAVSIPISNKKFLKEKLNIAIINPTKGRLHKAMLLSLQNAEDYLSKNFLKLTLKTNQILAAFNELEKLISISSLSTIEMLDNSHFFNQNPVGVICHFKNGKIDRYLCRKYTINITGPQPKSDYWYTRFVIHKHFTHLKLSKQNVPNLLVVDGGKLQINATFSALKELKISLPVVGLVKNRFHKTEALQLADGQRIVLEKNSPIYYLFFNMQEETHNYAVNFFRKKKLDSFFTSFLSTIPHIGNKRRQIIMEHFPTFNELKNASIEQICQIIPTELAKKVFKKIREFNLTQLRQKF